MRVVLHEYIEGGRCAFETTDDGAEVIDEWTGPRRVGERISAFVELGYDDTNTQGLEQLLEAMEWLAEQIKQRKGEPVPA